VLLRLQEKQQRSKLPRRMPCEKNTQVVGTLIPQESRTLHSNQLVNEENELNKPKATIF
jgi:hemin uptake protein HemP